MAVVTTASSALPLPMLLKRRKSLELELEDVPVDKATPRLEQIVTALPAPSTGRGLYVRNTFIETSLERSPSLEDFFRERKVTSCPSSRVGSIARSLRAMAEDLPGGGDDRVEDSSGGSDDEVEVVDEPGSCAGAPGSSEEVRGQPGSSAGASSPCTTPEHMSHPTPRCFPAVPFGAGALTLGCTMPYAFLATPMGVALPAGAELPVPWMWEEAALAPPTSAPRETWASASTEPESVEPPAPHMPPGTFFRSLPSLGSARHAAGRCKPCAFFHSKHCENGAECQFCHLCAPGEKLRRRKEKVELRKQRAREARQPWGEAWMWREGPVPWCATRGAKTRFEPRS